jgi:hypothetical protein
MFVVGGGGGDVARIRCATSYRPPGDENRCWRFFGPQRGSSARSEVSRMVTEKVSAGAEAVAILTRGGRAGGSNVLFKPSPEFRLDLFDAGCFFPR